MTSMFQRAIGADFDRLHPQMQRRFGVGLDSGEACIGTGVMQDVRHGPRWTLPFLQFGRLHNILVPDAGENVPFVIENYPYRDPFGRETVTFVRSYEIGGKQARFDATMIEHEGRVLDYLGTHQHLAVYLDLSVDERGGLVVRTDQQRLFAGPAAFDFPMTFSGRALLREWYDDEAECFRVDLEIRNKRLGFLFGYRGTFTCEFVPATDAPARLKPVHHERRVPLRP